MFYFPSSSRTTPSVLVFLSICFTFLISIKSSITFQDLNTKEMYYVDPCFDHWDLLRSIMPPGKPMVMIDIGANKGEQFYSYVILINF